MFYLLSLNALQKADMRNAKPKSRSHHWGYFGGDLELSAPRGGARAEHPTPHLSHLLFLEIRELRVEGEDRGPFFFSSSTHQASEGQTKSIYLKVARLKV